MQSFFSSTPESRPTSFSARLPALAETSSRTGRSLPRDGLSRVARLFSRLRESSYRSACSRLQRPFRDRIGLQAYSRIHNHSMDRQHACDVKSTLERTPTMERIVNDPPSFGFSILTTALLELQKAN